MTTLVDILRAPSRQNAKDTLRLLALAANLILSRPVTEQEAYARLREDIYESYPDMRPDGVTR